MSELDKFIIDTSCLLKIADQLWVINERLEKAHGGINTAIRKDLQKETEKLERIEREQISKN